MAKAAKVPCDRCESRIIAGLSYCPRCGYPTQWASHEERTRWEVSQWKTADHSKNEDGPSKSGQRRRGLPRPFARRPSPEPDWHLSLVPTPSATSTESPSVLVADLAPAGSPSKPAPTPAVNAPKAPAAPDVAIELDKIAADPQPMIEAKAGDEDPIRDMPRTMIAMRLLNARVAELHDRVQRLERELAESRRERSLTN